MFPDDFASHNERISEAFTIQKEKMMRKYVLAATLAASISLVGCTTQDRDTVAGAVVGGGLAAVTADALGASAGWTVAAGAAGATAGALYARNRRTNQCAFSNGDGTYRIRPCPN